MPLRCPLLGHKQTFCDANIMSALAPKADMCGALAHVCFVPKVDRLFNDLVGSIQQAKWHGETKRLGGLQVDNEIKFSWL